MEVWWTYLACHGLYIGLDVLVPPSTHDSMAHLISQVYYIVPDLCDDSTVLDALISSHVSINTGRATVLNDS